MNKLFLAAIIAAELCGSQAQAGSPDDIILSMTYRHQPGAEGHKGLAAKTQAKMRLRRVPFESVIYDSRPELR